MNVKVNYFPKSQTCQIVISDDNVFSRLRDAFSVPNDGKKFMKGPYRHLIPDQTYFITPTGKFQFGIAEMILSWIRQNVYDQTVEYEFNDDFKKRFAFEKGEIELINNLKLTPRSYQQDVIKLAIKHKFGTFVMGTGAGKTLTISSILDNLFHRKNIKKAMILVPDNGLVVQFEDELKNQYGMKQKISLFYGDSNTIDKEADIIIANRPLFLARFEKNKKFFTEEVDCLIVDEAHSIKKGNKVSKFLEKITAQYRFGFTGTLAENKEDKIRNLGILGPVRYEITSKELRDEGFLTNVQVHGLVLHHDIVESLKYRDEIYWLQNLPSRNNFIKQLCFKLQQNTLMMVNYLDHGFELERILKEENERLGNPKQVFFIRGEIDTDTREEVKRIMERDSNVLCIAITKIFSTGINIKNLHHIILAAGGKSSVTVVQSIGRGLRLHPNKKMLSIWDISDWGYEYSLSHAAKRKQIYDTEKIQYVPHTINCAVK